MRLAIILGTRPEIIKMSPLIRAAERAGHASTIVHTGQHYSHAMDRVFFEQLTLPEPAHNLAVGSGPHGQQTGKMLAGLERILMEEMPDAVLVQGDTNTVAAGALAAAKLRIPVGHVEAGLRSGDPGMPEEINRILADHVSTHLFAPTVGSADILRREGIPSKRIHVTGNTVVDAVNENRVLAKEHSTFLAANRVAREGYVLLTAHRQENVDDARRFRGILAGAAAVADRLDVPVIYPIHPRARKMMAEHGLDFGNVHLVEPLDYLDFLEAESNARIILTDSGGVQEEACVLRVPCVTLRDNTERPETVAVGANLLAGTDPTRILEGAEAMLHAPTDWANPFGDGDAAERILRIVEAGGEPVVGTIDERVFAEAR